RLAARVAPHHRGSRPPAQQRIERQLDPAQRALIRRNTPQQLEGQRTVRVEALQHALEVHAPHSLEPLLHRRIVATRQHDPPPPRAPGTRPAFPRAAPPPPHRADPAARPPAAPAAPPGSPPARTGPAPPATASPPLSGPSAHAAQPRRGTPRGSPPAARRHGR